MRKAHLPLLILIAVIGFVSNAAAKNRDKSWEFGALIQNVDTDSGSKVENSGAGELRFGYNFSSKVEAELLYASASTQFAGVDIDVAKEMGKVGQNPRALEPVPARDDDVKRITLNITGNFLTDRDGRTIPYITAGIGVIQELRQPFTFAVAVDNPNFDPMDPNSMMRIRKQASPGEHFDSSAILTLGVGGRTFFSDNWGVRYEARYNHHDSFQLGQDEYIICAGVTWIVGGKK